MFDLAPNYLDGRILDRAAGPASFNAEAPRKGRHVTSCDPLYRSTAKEIANRIDKIYETIVSGTKTNRDR
jgi:hypothetical protein